MNEFWIITQASIPVFLMMGAGCLARWAGWFPKEATAGTLKVVVNLLIPCLIISSVLGNEALKSPGNLIAAPLAGMLTLILGLAVGWASLRAAGFKKGGLDAKGRSYIVSVGLYNYGYIPFPLALALYDQGTVGVLFVFNVGVEVCVWTVVAACLGGYSPFREWKKVFNMPLLAILLALFLNFLNAQTWVPQALGATFEQLGACAYPVGLVVCGTVIYDLCREHDLLKDVRPCLVACGMRCFCLPVLFLFLTGLLPLTDELKRVLILQAAMPTAVFAMVLSQLYRADSPLAFRVVFLTTLLSIVLTPVWIHLGTRYLFP